MIKQTILKILITINKLFFPVKNLIFGQYYAKWLFNFHKEIINKRHFVEDVNISFERQDDDVKLIAFYLPQFHQIPLNDKYHGKGFTDWKNVASAIPQYIGHYQPQLPADCGFYDLSNPLVLEAQSKIAQKYGIYGFCYHYYWFSGERLLEKPIFDMLNNKNVTIPFCLCWANENWSKLWDGGNRELIKEQKLKDDDDEKFFFDILPFFKDERYIKIDNKPLLIIYRPNLFEKERFKKFINTQRDLARKEGFEDIYILTTNSFDFSEDPKAINLDGVVEFPPHGLIKNGIHVCLSKFIQYTNKNFNGLIFNMERYIKSKKHLKAVDFNLFKGVFPSWDNTARKAYTNAFIFDNLTPDNYKIWLRDCIKYTKDTKNKELQYVFINAWNEWAEGAHLEADTKYGYAYLQATKDVLEQTRKN